MKYECRHKGERVQSRSGATVACQYCDGVIEIQGNHVIAPTVRGWMATYPHEPDCGFTCPHLMTVENLKQSGVVKRVD